MQPPGRAKRRLGPEPSARTSGAAGTGPCILRILGLRMRFRLQVAKLFAFGLILKAKIRGETIGDFFAETENHMLAA